MGVIGVSLRTHATMSWVRSRVVATGAVGDRHEAGASGSSSAIVRPERELGGRRSSAGRTRRRTCALRPADRRCEPSGQGSRQVAGQTWCHGDDDRADGSLTKPRSRSSRELFIGLPRDDGARQRRAGCPARPLRGARRRRAGDGRRAGRRGRHRRALRAGVARAASGRGRRGGRRRGEAAGRAAVRLPNAHAHVLLDDDSEACMKPCAAVVPWVAKAIDIMVEEFRQGTGAAFGLFDLHDVQAAFTRPVFVNHLTQNWLPALPDVQAKLDAGRAGPDRRGRLRRGPGGDHDRPGYPNAEVDGYDLDEASIAVAQQAAAERVSAIGRGSSSRRRRPDHRGRLRPRHGDRDAARRARPGRHPADDADAGRARRHGPRRRRANRGRVHGADQRDGAVLLLVQHAALPGRQHAGRRRGHRDGHPSRHRAPLRGDAGFPDVEVLDVEHPQFVLYRLR